MTPTSRQPKKKITAQTARAVAPAAAVSTKPMVSEIFSHARFIHLAPRKVRLVVDQLRGKPVAEAQSYLQFVAKVAAQPIAKLLASAIANAEHNFHFDRGDLFIKKVLVNEGPTIKRFQPHAYGRSTTIRRRSSHLDLVLGVRPGAKQKVSAAPTAAKPEPAVKVLSADEVKRQSKAVGSEAGAPTGQSDKPKSKGFFRQVFSRKTGTQ